MNKEDFAEQVTAAEKTLYHTAKSILKNDSDCEDAVQEAIIIAYSKLGSLREERYFKTWLCRILINECYRIYRGKSRLISLEDYLPDEPPHAQGKSIGLYEAVSQLETELRLVIVLHYVDGFQTAEVAEILKIPEGTVKSRLSRARLKLKSVLDEEALSNE